MSHQKYYYIEIENPTEIQEIEEETALVAYKHLVLARKLNIVWLYTEKEGSSSDRFMYTFNLQRALIAELRSYYRDELNKGKPELPEGLTKTRNLSFSDIRNSLDKKPDERTINLYDEILRERLAGLPIDSYEDRAVTQAYILKNILKRKRFYVEARIKLYLDDLEESLKQQTKKLKKKYHSGKSSKSRAIHANTLTAFYSIAIELLSQVEMSFNERGFDNMSMRIYILKSDYYTELIRTKGLYLEYAMRSIWKYSTNYGVDLLRLFQTTIYFLVVFVSLFYVVGELTPSPLDKNGKAVHDLIGDPVYGFVTHPMLYNYNGGHDIVFHYIYLTIKLMAFRVETGFISVTLPEKMTIISAEVIGMILFGLLVVLISKKIIAK